MGIAYNTSIVRDGLVLHLDAANVKSYPGSGTTWKDLSGNGNDSTLENSPTYSSDNKGNFSFDGVDDYSIIDNETNLSSISNITVSVWINPNFSSMPSYANIVNKLTGNSENGWSLERYSGTTDISWWVGDRTINTTPWSNNNIRTTMDANTWQQIIGSFDGVNLKLYKNGSFVTESASSMGILTGNEKTHIGKHANFNYYWKNNISQVSIYNRALTVDEIKQNFEATRGRYGI